MTRLADNWLAAEPLLVERLRTQVPDLRAVYQAEDLAALDAQKDVRAAATPAAHVFYLGDQVLVGDDSSRNQGAAQVVDQIYGVALVVRNATGAGGLRADAGRLLPQLIRAIAGWDCGVAGLRPFRRAAVRTPPRYYADKAIFPLFFAARAFG